MVFNLLGLVIASDEDFDFHLPQAHIFMYHCVPIYTFHQPQYFLFVKNVLKYFAHIKKLS